MLDLNKLMSDTKKSNLRYIPGEKIIFEIRPSVVILIARLSPLLVAIAGIIAIFIFVNIKYSWVYLVVGLVGVFVGVIIFLSWYYSVFRLTNKRVENRYGIIGSREEEITLDDVQAVDVESNFWGAIFNFGTVVIKAAGSSREVDFTDIHNAKKVANQIEDLTTRNGHRHIQSKSN